VVARDTDPDTEKRERSDGPAARRVMRALALRLNRCGSKGCGCGRDRSLYRLLGYHRRLALELGCLDAGRRLVVGRGGVRASLDTSAPSSVFAMPDKMCLSACRIIGKHSAPPGE
jgi:hypothetical protein